MRHSTLVRRASIGLALWYPILVLSLAYALFLGLVIEVIPRFIGAFESLGIEIIGPLRWLERVGERLGLSEALLGMVAALAAAAPEITSGPNHRPSTAALFRPMPASHLIQEREYVGGELLVMLEQEPVGGIGIDLDPSIR